VKTVAGKPCNVVELQGTVGASVAIDRKKGFADAILKRPTSKSFVLNPATSPAVRERGHGKLYQSGEQRQKHLHGLCP
jgi:hypothetical protein